MTLQKLVSSACIAFACMQSIASANELTCTTIRENLELGSKGSEVKTLQDLLVQRGLLSSASQTGVFDDATQRAVEALQLDLGVLARENATPDSGYGTVGPRTRTAISRATCPQDTGTRQSLTAQTGATPVCTMLTTNLARGSQGDSVLALQRYLIARAVLESDLATGFYGQMTQNAVQRAQRQLGVITEETATESQGYGSAGPRTRTAIAKDSCGDNAVLPTTTSSQPRASLSNATDGRITLNPSTTGANTGSRISLNSSNTASLDDSDDDLDWGDDDTDWNWSADWSGLSDSWDVSKYSSWSSSSTQSNSNTPSSFEMSSYWPRPQSGKAHLKMYSTDFYGSGASVDSMISKTTRTSNNKYLATDVLTKNSEFVGSRYISILFDGQVIEYRSDTASQAFVYKDDKEVNWGDTLRVGDSIESSIEIDPEESNGAVADSPMLYGYNKLTLVQYIPTMNIGGKEYSSVLKFLSQRYFCITDVCTGSGSVEGVDYNRWEMEYWMAPGKGILQTKYLSGSVNGRIDYASKECTVPEEQWYCN